MAAAELAEETGLRAGSSRSSATSTARTAWPGEGVHVFLATDLTPGVPNREQTEQDMARPWFPQQELEQMSLDGTITDGPSPAAYLLLTLRSSPRGRMVPPNRL